LENTKESYHLRELSVDGKIVYKCILGTLYKDVDQIHGKFVNVEMNLHVPHKQVKKNKLFMGDFIDLPKN
jgi:hypothetical protein